MQKSVDIYSNIEKSNPVGWKRSGSLILARTDNRITALLKKVKSLDLINSKYLSSIFSGANVVIGNISRY